MLFERDSIDPGDIYAVLRNYSWNVDFKVLCKSIAPTVVINQGGKATFGKSKFFGTPDIPDNMILKTESNYQFVFQLNFKQLFNYDVNDLLPTDGMLYFFVNTLAGTDSCKAIYYPHSIKDTKETDGLKMELNMSFSLPCAESPEADRINLSNDTKTIVEASQKIWDMDGTDYHYSRLFGYPVLLQSYPWWHQFREKAWQVCGRAPSDPEQYSAWKKQFDEEISRLKQSVCFLFQGPTPFNDLSVMYIGIDKEDLAQQKFDNLYFDIQST